jgi:hypothetical protein
MKLKMCMSGGDFFLQKYGQSRRFMVSLVMLVSWEVWKKRDHRVFRSHSSTVIIIVARIKEEVDMWSLVGAKALSLVISRE